MLVRKLFYPSWQTEIGCGSEWKITNLGTDWLSLPISTLLILWGRWYSKISIENLHHTGWGKNRFTVTLTQNMDFILVSLFINYCIVSHRNNCKLTFAPPSIINFEWRSKLVYMLSSRGQPSLVCLVLWDFM